MSATKTKTNRTIRETTSKWEFNGADGKVESKEITVNYFSPTVAQLKADRLAEAERQEKNPDSVIWITDSLAPIIHSLHDLPGDQQSVTAPSIAWLDEQDLKNLTSVRDAIDEDLKAGK